MKEIFQKEYDGESICDIERDVLESLSAQYNPIMTEIPVDEYYIPKGKFIVAVVWTPDEE